MNTNCSASQHRLIVLAGLCVGVVLLAPLSGCSRSPSEPAAPVPAALATDEASEGVALSAADVKSMGIETSAASGTVRVPEVAGFGVVLAHETVAQSVADLSTAIAVQRQSESAFERSKRLAGTTGAMAADVQEAAERQAVVDRAALELVKRRASSIWGQNPPWKNHGISADVTAIARGESKMVRVTFPLGALGDAVPKTLRLGPIAADPSHSGWQSTAVWAAPADTSMPGTSFFALLKGNSSTEGERLAAWAAVGAAENGVVIPASAVIISNGKYWFYVETKPNVFLRTELDTNMPTTEGFFVRHGVAVGAKIVTTSAGQLLARETNPTPAAE
jgi:hypothetical protein